MQPIKAVDAEQLEQPKPAAAEQAPKQSLPNVAEEEQAAGVQPHELVVHLVKEFMPQSMGVRWVCGGLLSYMVVTVIIGWSLHSSAAAETWRSQVSSIIYERSLCVFGCAFFIDVLSAVFVSSSTKLDYVLLPCFIKGMATVTNWITRNGRASMAFTTGGRILLVQRYICWMTTTPSVLMVISMVSETITKDDTLHAIMWDEVMLLTGALATLTTGRLQVLFTLITHASLIPVALFMWRGLREASQQMALQNVPRTPLRALAINYSMPVIMVVLWAGFGVVWDLGILGYISMETEEVFNLFLDFTAKVMFSCSLMLSSFKSIEWRREGVMRSIEESHRQTLIEELQDVVKQKDRFMSTVSHELRTPLNGIIGISEGMLSGACGTLNETVRRQLYIIRTSGARLLSLVADVMDASSMRSGLLVLRRERVPLRQMVDDLFDLMRSLVCPDVELQNAVPHDIIVAGDTHRIVQILNNLLGNAAKFTSRGYIRVSALEHEGSDKVAISVHDSGIGIPEYKLQSIFLPFEQVDMTIARKHGGMGLGLNIVRELVKAHGGDIWVQSVEKKGSCFTFLLPSWEATQRALESRALSPDSDGNVAAPEDAAVADDGQYARERVTSMPAMEWEALPYDRAQLKALADSGTYAKGTMGAAAAHGAPAPQGETRPSHFERFGQYQILSVDDDATNHAVVQLLLSPTGYSVLTLMDGKEAMDHLTTCEVLPDLMLLDIMMPRLNGYEVLQQLHEQHPALLARLPIIMVTARNNEADIVRGLSSGAVDYCTKPLKRTDFLARVEARLALARDMAAAAAASKASSGNAAIVSPGTVLCIGDDTVTQAILQGVLQSAGFTYKKASTGKEAMPLLAPDVKRLPDVVLLDMSLPDMDGMDLLAHIRENYGMLQMPVLMLAARAEENSVTSALQSGANDYMAVPFRRSELLARVRMHLHSSLTRGTDRNMGSSGASGRASRAGSMNGSEGGARAGQVQGMVPVLAGRINGLRQASARLKGDTLAVLLGNVRDTVDTLYEKYAVVKADQTDDAFSFISPQGSEEADLGQSFKHMLQFSNELQAAFSRLVPAHGIPAGALSLSLVLHVGKVQSGVVGRRRPQYRYFGEALQHAKDAANEAPDGALAVTDAAATLLSGASSSQPLSKLQTGRGESAGLWVLQTRGPRLSNASSIGGPGSERSANPSRAASGLLPAAEADVVMQAERFPMYPVLGSDGAARWVDSRPGKGQKKFGSNLKAMFKRRVSHTRKTQ